MKYILSLALIASLSLTGCLSAPANDQDRAGEQKTRQVQSNSPLRMDRESARSVTINVSVDGEGATVNLMPNTAAITGAVDTGGNQGVQGSTDQAGAGATQSPSTKLEADATVPLK